MPIAAAIPAIIGAAGSIGGALIGKSGANKASSQLQQSQQAVIDEVKAAVQSGQMSLKDAIAAIYNATSGGQSAISDATMGGLQAINAGIGNATGAISGAQEQQLGLLQPFINQTGGTLQNINSILGPGGPLTKQFSFTPQDLQNDPGYAFTLAQGKQAIQRAAASQGNLFSTGTLKALNNYAQGTADTYFNDAFNRQLQTFNTNRTGTLQQLSGLQNLLGTAYGASGTGVNLLGQNAGQIANLSQQGAEALANLGLTGANQYALLGLQGTQSGLTGANELANLGLSGAQIIGNALTNQGNAAAAGTAGNTQGWLNILNGTTGLLSQIPGLFNQVSAGNTQSGVGAIPPFQWPTSPVATPPFVGSY